MFFFLVFFFSTLKRIVARKLKLILFLNMMKKREKKHSIKAIYSCELLLNANFQVMKNGADGMGLNIMGAMLPN